LEALLFLEPGGGVAVATRALQIGYDSAVARRIIRSIGELFNGCGAVPH